jgi:hypothetical protein
MLYLQYVVIFFSVFFVLCSIVLHDALATSSLGEARGVGRDTVGTTEQFSTP